MSAAAMMTTTMTATTMAYRRQPRNLRPKTYCSLLVHTAPHGTMAGPTTRARASWVADRITALPEMWALVALHLRLVGAWRLMLVCKAARVGAKDFLKTPHGLVVCGGHTTGGGLWSRCGGLISRRCGGRVAMPALEDARCYHAYCAVRDNLVVVGGAISEGTLGSVEMLAERRRVRGPAALDMWRDGGRSSSRSDRERQRCGASAPAWRIWRRWRPCLDGVPGRSGHRRVHSATKSPSGALSFYGSVVA